MQWWRTVGIATFNLIGLKFEPQTFRFRDEYVLAAPTGCLKCCCILDLAFLTVPQKQTYLDCIQFQAEKVLQKYANTACSRFLQKLSLRRFRLGREVID